MQQSNFWFDDDRMEARQAAHYLGLSVASLARDRARGNLGNIPYYLVGRRVFYRRTEIDSWVSAQLQVTPKHYDPRSACKAMSMALDAIRRHMSPTLKCLDLPVEEAGVTELRLVVADIVDEADTLKERLDQWGAR